MVCGETGGNLAPSTEAAPGAVKGGEPRAHGAAHELAQHPGDHGPGALAAKRERVAFGPSTAHNDMTETCACQPSRLVCMSHHQANWRRHIVIIL